MGAAQPARTAPPRTLCVEAAPRAPPAAGRRTETLLKSRRCDSSALGAPPGWSTDLLYLYNGLTEEQHPGGLRVGLCSAWYLHNNRRNELQRWISEFIKRGKRVGRSLVRFSMTFATCGFISRLTATNATTQLATAVEGSKSVDARSPLLRSRPLHRARPHGRWAERRSPKPGTTPLSHRRDPQDPVAAGRSSRRGQRRLGNDLGVSSIRHPEGVDRVAAWEKSGARIVRNFEQKWDHRGSNLDPCSALALKFYSTRALVPLSYSTNTYYVGVALVLHLDCACTALVVNQY